MDSVEETGEEAKDSKTISQSSSEETLQLGSLDSNIRLSPNSFDARNLSQSSAKDISASLDKSYTDDLKEKNDVNQTCSPDISHGTESPKTISLPKPGLDMSGPIIIDSFDESRHTADTDRSDTINIIHSDQDSESRIPDQSANESPDKSFETISNSSQENPSPDFRPDNRMSTNSDVQIVENLLVPEARQASVELIADTKVTDSIEIIEPSPVLENSGDNVAKSSLPDEETEKAISAYMTREFPSAPVFASSPNELPPPKTEGNMRNSPSLGDSTESLTSVPAVFKKFILCVEVGTMLHINKTSSGGELINITCDDLTEPMNLSLRRVSESSGNLADVSKSTSASSVSGSVTQYSLKSNRFSFMSSSSSSSLGSTASNYLRKLCMFPQIQQTQNKKEEFKLTDERINELRQKWLNTEEIYKILDYLDKLVMYSDTVNTDSFTKLKPPVEETVKQPLPSIEETSTPVSTNKTRATRGKRQAKVKFAPAESDSDVPKKRQRRADSIDVPAVNPSTFTKGDNVFAKWVDRKFYAATLGEQTPEGKWVVNFFDGDNKSMFEEFLIKAEEFTLVGHSVYASQGDDNFTPGIITGCDIKNGVLQYNVVRDKGDISVPCQFIYITESQARQIRGKSMASSGLRTTPKTTDISASNSSVKRSTRSKTRLLLADSPKPSSSGTQRKVLSDSDDDGNDDTNVEDVAGVEPESQGVYENGIKLKGKSVTGKMRFARSKTNDADATVLGPMPEEGSKYFKNLNILLTCTQPMSPKVTFLDTNGSGNETSNTDSENYKFSSIPFVKDRLKLQLQMGGATVYNNFLDVPPKLWKSTYLISNRPNISAKYIQCIAVGIKCVCHDWVIRCCIEKKRVQVQELPIGWSVERERFYNYTDRKTAIPLKKYNLLVVDTADKNFYKFWSRVCKLAEANVSKLSRDSNLEQVSAVICEAGYRDDHVDRVLSHNVPLVTTTWLVHCLIHGEVRSFEHKSFRAEYVDSD